MKSPRSGWKGESRRHSLARKGIRTADHKSNIKHQSNGIVQRAFYMHELRKIFDKEVYFGTTWHPDDKTHYPKPMEEMGFESIINKADKDRENITDEDLSHIIEYSEILYIKYIRKVKDSRLISMKSSGELQLKVPINVNDDILLSKLRKIDPEAGTDGYYQDPNNYYTAIIRIPHIDPVEFNRQKEEVMKIAKKVNAKLVYEDNGKTERWDETNG